MSRKIVGVLIVLVTVFASGTQLSFCQEEQQKEEASLDTAAIMVKLDEVLANQAKIFEQFEEIKEELGIIKVRASR